MELLIELFFFTFLLPRSGALHCFSHDHCGEYAVCVQGAMPGTPKCMCLLGFHGNGAHCRKLPSNSEAGNSILSKTEQKGDKVIIERCGAVKAAAVGKEVMTLGSRAGFHILRVGKAGKTQKAPYRGLCPQVECPFDTGPCLYQNDRRSSWELKKISNGYTVTASGLKRKKHYLLSVPFRIQSDAVLEFDYFSSHYLKGHLAVYDGDLDSLLWTSGNDTLGAGWTKKAQIPLAQGDYEIVFGAENLLPTTLVALDNVKLLRSSDGALQTCLPSHKDR